MDFSKYVLVAVLIEALWETGKMIWQDGKLNIDRLGAMVVGIVLAVVVKADFIAAVGLEHSVPVVGYIFSGIILSRGANFAHDIVSTIGNISSATKQ